MNLRRTITTSFCLTFLTSTITSGQENRPAAQPAQPGRNPAQVQVNAPAGVQVRAGGAMRHANTMTNDQVLANCIAIANQTEVAVAKEAESRLTNKDAKEFASMLIKEHQEFLQKLERFAPEASRAGFLSTTTAAVEPQQQRTEVNRNEIQQPAAIARQAPAQNQQAPQGQQVTENQAGADANQRLDMVQLHREIAEECIQSAKNAMSKKDGADADLCFIGFQIAAHAMMKDKLIVFQRHASAELSPTISEGLAATERHMKKAEAIMKTLRKSNDERVTSKN